MILWKVSKLSIFLVGWIKVNRDKIEVNFCKRKIGVKIIKKILV